MKIYDEPFEYGDLPIGFGMALMKNTRAFKAFSRLSDEERNAVIEGTHTVSSKGEMQSYVARLADREL